VTNRLTLLSSLARELQKPHAFGDLLQLVVERCAALLGTQRASIRLLDPGGTRLLAVCRTGTPLHLDPKEEFRIGEGLLGWIVQNGEPLRTGDAENDPRFTPRAGMVEPIGSFIGVPLIAGDSALGVLSTSLNRENAFSPEDEEHLTLLAGIAAPHIEIARRDFVVRDPLTGLYNHAFFQEHLEREIERSVAYGLPMSLLLVDLDRFEAVNEAAGHQVGGTLLKTVAGILSGRDRRPGNRFRLRGQDFVARYGGDEFALVLPYTSKEGAEAKAEMLRRHLEGYDFAALDLPPQTVSIGLATVPDDAHDRGSLIAAADKAMRAAKRRGRNTLVAYSSAISAADAIDSARAVDIDELIALESTIENAAFDYVYQPILDAASGAVVAYEALCRPTHARFSGPVALIEAAERAGRVVELGRACRVVSTRPIDRLPPSCLLFLNLHPRELDDSALLHDEGMLAAAPRLVLEITETAAVGDYERVRDILGKLRKHGYRIALDDLGAGYAGLNSLSELHPDYVKLDMALIRGIHTRTRTRRLVKHLLEFCAGENIPVIAEGVQSADEHEMVRSIGCPMLQGDYLGPPRPAFL